MYGWLNACASHDFACMGLVCWSEYNGGLHVTYVLMLSIDLAIRTRLMVLLQLQVPLLVNQGPARV